MSCVYLELRCRFSPIRGRSVVAGSRVQKDLPVRHDWVLVNGVGQTEAGILAGELLLAEVHQGLDRELASSPLIIMYQSSSCT
jgi:hypothetical protein